MGDNSLIEFTNTDGKLIDRMLKDLYINSEEQILQNLDIFKSFISWSNDCENQDFVKKIHQKFSLNSDVCKDLMTQYVSFLKTSIENDTKNNADTKKYFRKQTEKILKSLDTSTMTVETQQELLNLVKDANDKVYKIHTEDGTRKLITTALASLACIAIAVAVFGIKVVKDYH